MKEEFLDLDAGVLEDETEETDADAAADTKKDAAKKEEK